MNKEIKISNLQNDIDEIRNNITFLSSHLHMAQNEIDEKRNEIENFEINIYDYEEEYREHLDEEGDVVIDDITYSNSEYMEMENPTEYKNGLRDYAYSIDIKDNEKYAEVNAELLDLINDKEITQEIIEDLESELNELQEEITMLNGSNS